jgi:uncharacterized membrane protein YphA (DoxX/SURF4 family)
MQRLYSMFPSGAPGVGLLLLRLVIAGSLQFDSAGYLTMPVQPALFAGLLVVSVALVVGVLTPWFALAAVSIEAARLLSGAASAATVTWLCPFGAVGLALLGPGAYSLDARLFGRRRVLVDSRSASDDRH